VSDHVVCEEPPQARSQRGLKKREPRRPKPAKTGAYVVAMHWMLPPSSPSTSRLAAAPRPGWGGAQLNIEGSDVTFFCHGDC
jgi:hypothetical protein